MPIPKKLIVMHWVTREHLGNLRAWDNRLGAYEWADLIQDMSNIGPRTEMWLGMADAWFLQEALERREVEIDGTWSVPRIRCMAICYGHGAWEEEPWSMVP